MVIRRLDSKFVVLAVGIVGSCFCSWMIWCTNYYSDRIRNSLTLAEDKMLYQWWVKPQAPVPLCVNLFNYTNGYKFEDRTQIKLDIVEIGPYCYDEFSRKVDVVRFPNYTLAYNEWRKQVFRDNLSVNSDESIIVAPSIPPLAAISMVSALSYFKRKAATFFLNRVSGLGPFTRKTVKEYFFGYTDEVLQQMGKLAEYVGVDFPQEFSGVFSSRVGLSGGRILIWTGEDNIDRGGQVINLNNITHWNAWSTKQCNRVKGSDGLLFNRSQVKNFENLTVHHPTSCRALKLQFNSTVNLGLGVTLYRYVLAADTYDVRTAENKCLCVTDVCRIMNGVLDIRTCLGPGIPILLSRPYFEGADIGKEYTFKDMKLQNKSRPQFYLDIFPMFGLTVAYSICIQISILVDNYGGGVELGNLPDTYVLPILWAEMEISGDNTVQCVPSEWRLKPGLF